ncbi:MAG: metal ABC transporter substrate-binding protein [Patescibacteria group bacterium]
MKKTLWLVAVAVVLTGAIYWLMKSPIAKTSEDKNTVVATIQPVADMVRVIAGGRFEVVEILPPGASPHTYELTPDKVKAMTGAQVIFTIDVLDGWIDDSAESLGIPKYAVHDGIQLREAEPEPGETPEEFDPHYWLTIPNAKIMAGNISEKLSQLDSAHANEYHQRLSDYEIELDKLDQSMRQDFAGMTNKKLITFHDSWNYFAAEYGFTIAAVFEASPGKEPVPQYVKKIYDIARADNIPAIFSEPTLPTSTLEPFVNDLGIQMYNLDPEGGMTGVDTYLAMMRYNADTLVQALK